LSAPINPLQVPAVTTALTIPSAIDYTSKDFLGFISSMETYAQQAMPEWNIGATEGDIGLAIMEAVAYVGDILSYYGDRISQEAYLSTATQRQSLLNIAQLLGYTVSNGSPAKGTVTFQTAVGAPAVIVPAGTQLTAGYVAVVDATLIYTVDAGQANYTVPAAGGTLTLNVTQGLAYNGVTLGRSDGSAAQTFSIPQTGVIDGSVTLTTPLTATTVQSWTYVQFLGDFGPSDPVFTTYLDSAGLTWIEFGDGINGLVPTTGTAITVSYIVGAGSAGNLQAGAVGYFVNPIPNVATKVNTGGASFVSSAMTGGTDPETNDQIRANAPASYATTQRAVSLTDFIAMAQNIPGVTAATAVAAHSTSVTLYLMGANNQAASTTVQASVEAFFQGKTLAGVTLTTAQPTLVAIDVGTNSNPVQLFINSGFSQAGVIAKVQSAVAALFTAPNVSFGQTINVGTIYSTVLAISGVQYCVIPVILREDAPQSDTTPIQLRSFEIAVPGVQHITATGGI
jgi:hypothetical protein